MATLSEYEQLRHENIEKNSRFLRDIGITPTVPTINKVAKRKREVKPPSVFVMGERRSSRIAHQPNVEYKEDSISLTVKAPRVAVIGEEEDDTDYSDSDAVPPQTLLPSIRSEPTAGSTRSLHANLDIFLSDDQFGSPVSAFGKLHVVTVANNGVVPRFSKYSGVLEWKNCVFLWVNVQCSKASQYDNTFSDGGREIVWFGGSRMTGDTEVVKRILSVRADVKSEDAVVLFVRIEGEPYTCLGRLSLLTCSLKRQPIRFVWRLEDFDRLQNGPHKDNFQRIVSA